MDKSKTMMIVIIVLLLALIGTVAGVAVYMLTFLRGMQQADNAAQRPLAQVVTRLTPDQMEEVALSEPIVTNLAAGLDGKTSHMASINISIEIDMTDKKNSAKFFEMIKTKEAIIKNLCLGIIRNMTYEEIQKADSQAVLKKDILDGLREMFQSNLIYEVSLYGYKFT